MIKVTNEIVIYEVDGRDDVLNDAKLIVESHWNYNERIVLDYGGKKITVIASDLEKAISNAKNSNRF